MRRKVYRGISRRNYPVTIRFNAERPWKRLFTPGINHVGTSQGRMHLPSADQVDFILGSGAP